MRYQFVFVCSCYVNSRVHRICQSVRQPVTVVMQLRTYGDSQSRSKTSEVAAGHQHKFITTSFCWQIEAIKTITHLSNRAISAFKELTGSEFYSKFQVRQHLDFLIFNASVVAVTPTRFYIVRAHLLFCLLLIIILHFLLILSPFLCVLCLVCTLSRVPGLK